MNELPRGIIKHTQLFLHDPENGVYGDCWRATVASLLRLPIEAVPHVCDGPDDGMASERMRTFLESQNCALIQIPFNGEMSLEQVLDYIGSVAVSGGLHWCLMGTSRTGCNHVVICKGNEIVHDPSITRSGIVGPASDGLWWAEWIVQRPACDALGVAAGTAKIFGPYAHLNGPRALAEDSWSVEDDPIENNEEYFSVPLFAQVEVTFPVTHGAPNAEAHRAYADELRQDAGVSASGGAP